MILINILIVVLLIIIYFSRFNLNNQILLCIYIYWSLYLLIKIMTSPLEKATDYRTYISAFNKIQESSIFELLSLNIFEPLFRIFAWILLNLFTNNTYIIIVLIINLIFAFAIYNLFEDKILSTLGIVFYIYNPLFLSMSTNILRQMIVIGLILLILRNKHKFTLLKVSLPLVHFSSLPIAIFFMIHRLISLKILFFITMISCILFLSNLNSYILGDILSINNYSTELSFKNYGNSGNRNDFFILTTLVLCLSIFMYKKNIISSFMLKYTFLSTTLYYLMGYQAFSERFAVYNWILLLIFVPNILVLIRKGVKF